MCPSKPSEGDGGMEGIIALGHLAQCGSWIVCVSVVSLAGHGPQRTRRGRLCGYDTYPVTHTPAFCWTRHGRSAFGLPHLASSKVDLSYKSVIMYDCRNCVTGWCSRARRWATSRCSPTRTACSCSRGPSTRRVRPHLPYDCESPLVPFQSLLFYAYSLSMRRHGGADQACEPPLPGAAE
jgi:hypothetical protein